MRPFAFLAAIGCLSMCAAAMSEPQERARVVDAEGAVADVALPSPGRSTLPRLVKFSGQLSAREINAVPASTGTRLVTFALYAQQ